MDNNTINEFILDNYETMSYTEMAKALTEELGTVITQNAVRKRYNRLRISHGLPPKNGAVEEIDTKSIDDRIRARKLAMLERQVRTAENTEEESKARHQLLLETLETAVTPLNFKQKPITVPALNKNHTEAVCLILSDLHFGKRTKFYNIEIAKQKFNTLIDNFIQIVNLHRVAYPIDELHIFLTGDIVDGDGIYPTHPHHTDTHVVNQVFRTVETLVERFAQLANMFENVYVHSVRGNHGRLCHDSETEVLTKRGWLKFSELELTDMIATQSTVLESGYLEWQHPDAIHKFEYRGPMFRVKDRENDFLVTPEHRMLVTNDRRKSLMMAQDALIPIRHIPLDNQWKSPKVLSKRRQIDWGVSDDTLRAMAWVQTDGSIDEHGYVRIWQSKEVEIEKIHTILNNLKLEYSFKRRPKKDHVIIDGVRVTNQRTSHVFSLTANSSRWITDLLPSKHNLPEWIWELSTRQINVWLDSLLDGDGSRWKSNGKSRVLYGTHGFLSNIQAVLVTHGIPCKLCKNNRGDYSLNIGIGNRSSTVYFRKSNTSLEEYKGDVWCVTVPNSTLVTRRNGCTLISGNSKNAHESANWDYLYSLTLELACKNIPNMTFNTPEDWHQVVDVKGTKILQYHGHQIKMTLNMPYYGVTTRISRWAASNRVGDFDVAVQGHFHSSSCLNWNNKLVFLNGTLVDGDEFALEFIGLESSEAQWAFGVHKNRGVTWRYELKPN